MKVAIGLSYVGCVSAAVLAPEGHDVLGVDLNATKVAAVARGESSVAESGLPDLVRRGHQSGRLTATTDPTVVATLDEEYRRFAGMPRTVQQLGDLADGATPPAQRGGGA
jgi:UDP-glucose 6-dehydrogenase